MRLVWLTAWLLLHQQAMPLGAPLPPQEVHVPKRKRTCAAGPSLEAQPGPASNGLSTVPKVHLGCVLLTQSAELHLPREELEVICAHPTYSSHT